jgi:GAF domain-containing protein
MAEGMIKQAQYTSERLRRLYELALTVAGDPTEVFDQIVRIIAEIFHVRVALVERIDGDKIETISMYFDGKLLHEGTFDLPGTPCANVHEAKSFCSFNAAAQRFPHDQFLIDHNIESYIGMPVVSADGQVIAIINAMHDCPISFGEEDVLFLKALASRVRLELERQRHATEARAALAMLDIAQEISRLRSLDETLQLIADSVKGMIAVDIVAVATVDDADGRTSLKAAAGFKTDAIGSAQYPPGRGTSGRAIAARRTVLLEGIGERPDLPSEEFPIHTAEGVRNAAGIPLIVADRVVGALILGYRSESALPQHHIKIAEAMAAQAAVAIENSRLFSELSAANERLLEADGLKTSMISELSTPVIPVWDGVLLAPIVGPLDRERAELITNAVLNKAADTHALVVIVDITGVRTLDTDAAQHVVNTAEAVRVLGATCIVTGIGAKIARTLVHLGIKLEGIPMRRKLSDGLKLALQISDLKFES